MRAELDQRLLRARIQLALHQPFLASAVMRLPIRAAPDVTWCPTMSTDGYHVFYNPLWTETLSDHELRGVIAHEVLHVVFAHDERRQHRYPRRWNIACDHAINLLLLAQGFRLPEEGLFDKQFIGMPAEQIYEQLPNESDSPDATAVRTRRGFPNASRPEWDDEGADGAAGVLVAIGADLVSPDDPRVRLFRDDDAPDREQLTALRENLRSDAISRLHGRAAAQFRQECKAANLARIDWRGVLRCWLHDRILNDWRTFPFSRKHLARGLFMPSLGIESPTHIIFAIDTSGSMTQEMLSDIIGELRAFRETFPCRLTVIQCDARIHSVTEYEAMDGTEVPATLSIKGRGGTDFAPIFEWVATNTHSSFPVLLYATDGYGTFWDRDPDWPVVWLMTQRDIEVPYGRVIEI